MPKRFFPFYLIAFAFLITTSDISADSFEITPNIYHFNYEEFSTSGQSLDKEVGFLPGIKFSLSQSHNGNKYIVYATLHDGTVDYTGGTQSGQPHTTRTKEQLLQAGLEFKLKKVKSLPGQLVIGLRHWEWDRNILDNNNIQGLHEIYTWNEISVGLNFESEKKNESFFWTTISALYTLNPDIELILENSSLSLSLDQKPGFRLHTGKTWAQDNKVSYSFSIIVEYWEFGRSNTEFTDDFFGNSFFVTEPRSESFHTGIEFNYIYHY